MYAETTRETPASVGINHERSRLLAEGLLLSKVIPGFLSYAQYDRMLSPETTAKYRDCLGWIVRDLGDLPVTEIGLSSITELKRAVSQRGAGESRLAQITFALKSLLRYCTEVLELPVLPPQKIRAPRRSRRQVVFLTPEEIEQFVGAIRLGRSWAGKSPRAGYRLDGLRFRTLVEVLLGTGMRISEALALRRDRIDYVRGEARIVGKGNKERTVFFTERSLYWIQLYLSERTDDEPLLFVTQRLSPLDRADVSSLFRRYRTKAGLEKKVTPHILRHTTATTLLFNGCPISHVKEILGHDRLETTCKYYLGVDQRKAKEAHKTFLDFSPGARPPRTARSASAPL